MTSAAGMEGCIVENAILPDERLSVSRSADEKWGSSCCRDLEACFRCLSMHVVLCVVRAWVPKIHWGCYRAAEAGWGKLGSSHERAQLPWTRLVTKVLEQLCKAVGQATTKASIMAVIGESCASLTPYGVDHSVAGDPYRP